MPCTTIAGNIQILYQATPIDGTSAITLDSPDSGTGIYIQEVIAGVVSACNPSAGTYLSGAYSFVNAPEGGIVNIGMNNGAVMPSGEQIIVNGVRADITSSPASTIGGRITAQMITSPGNIASFLELQREVGESADPLSILVSGLVMQPCNPPQPGAATVSVTEGFRTAFVDHGDPGESASFPGPAAGARPGYGGTNNSRVTFVVSGLPAGLTIAWPVLSAPDATTAAVMERVSQSASGDVATYAFSTPNQAQSDGAIESFTILLLPFTNFVFTGTAADLGTFTANGRMAPLPTPDSSAPRFDHPLELDPAYTLGTIVKGNCTTPPSTLSLFAGGNQTGMPGQQLANMVVRVADDFGNRVPSYPVVFAITDGGGTLSVTDTLTDFLGMATAVLTLGPAPGITTVTATAEPLAGSPITFTATAIGSGPPPAISEGSTVNNASFALHPAPLAPGSIAAIFGTNLNDGLEIPSSFFDNGKLSTMPGGASVTVNGIPAPLFYSFPTQLGIQIPRELASETSATLQVIALGQTSEQRTIFLDTAAPGVFSINQAGSGPGTITHTDGAVISEESPATVGEDIILFATGLGAVDPATETGAPAGASLATAEVSVLVDGVGVVPDYAGTAPGFVGLDQVNFTVPPGTRIGNDVTVQLVVDGKQSNVVTIAVVL